MGFHTIGGGTSKEPRGQEELNTGSFPTTCYFNVLFSIAGIKPKILCRLDQTLPSATELHPQSPAIVPLRIERPAVLDSSQEDTNFRVPILPALMEKV